MSRTDYYNDPQAPRANHIIPGASAVVTNQEGDILLHLRADNQLWGLPGGGMEIGESIAQTIKREVREETGLRVRPEYIVGIYSDPKHVVAFSDGEVRQQFSICFACSIIGGKLRSSSESHAVQFFKPAQLKTLPMHRSTRLRIRHYLEHRAQPYFS